MLSHFQAKSIPDTFKRAIFIVLATVASLTAGLLSATEITAVAPGTAFTPNEPLMFIASNTENQPWKYEITDWQDRSIASGTWTGTAKLCLDKLVPGYYFLKIPALKTERSFVVLARDPKAGENAASSFALDSAQSELASWAAATTLSPRNGYDITSALERRSGAAMVRGRENWEAVEKTPGVFGWGVYGESMSYEAKYGVRMLGMFQNAPAWTKQSPGQRLPDDLLALYRFGATAAEFFAPAVYAWEFWNEQDATDYMAAWDYAACLKAFYLGVKSKKPELPVLPGGISLTPPNSSNSIVMANDAGLYFDVYNFHTYKGLQGFPDLVAGIRKFMKKSGIDSKPIWVTENGTNVEGAAEGQSMLAGYKAHTFQQELQVAEFVPKAQVLMSSLGIARTFTFVLSPYDEMHGSKDWGLLRRDYSAKPGYAAFANLTAQLGRAQYAGEVKLNDKSRGFLYLQPDKSYTMVFWSQSNIDATADGSDQKISLNLPAGRYETNDVFGTPGAVNAQDGKLLLTAGRYPTYLHGLPALPVIPPAPVIATADTVKPAQIDKSMVFRVHLSNDFELASSNSSVSTQTNAAKLTLDVWNLSAVVKTGSIAVTGGNVIGLPASLTLQPWEMKQFKLTVEPQIPTDKIGTDLVFRGNFNGLSTSVLCIPIRNFQRIVDVGETRPLPWTAQAGYWRANSSGKMDITQDEAEKAVKFHTVFPTKCDSWIYPEYVLQLPQDSLAGSYALAFEVKCAPENVGKFAMLLMLVAANVHEVGPSVWLPVKPATDQWEERIVPLENIDPATIKLLRIGANCMQPDFTYWLRNIRILYLK